MASEWQVAYDEGITEDEKRHLETLEDTLIRAFGMKSLRWFGITDERGKLYRVTEYSNPSNRLAQFTWANLTGLSSDMLSYKINGGEFRCPNEQDEGV
jgi:hypothetical protein